MAEDQGDHVLMIVHGFDRRENVHLISIGVHAGDNESAERMGKNVFNGNIDNVNSYPGDDSVILIFYKKSHYPLGNVRDLVDEDGFTAEGLTLSQAVEQAVEDESMTACTYVFQHDENYSNQLSTFDANFIVGVSESGTSITSEIEELLTLTLTPIDGPGFFFQAQKDVVIRRREAVQRKVVKSLRL